MATINTLKDENFIGKSNRVVTLYRVSGTKQVDFNEKHEADIPLQRIACHKFIERYGLTLVAEKQENGVSGFKVSASKRDKIQEIKEMALRGEFDILLVFMFDRVGRISSETPFIVEWFVDHGIRVFSCKEGEQRFDNHVDKLTNYIRFWQSEGESIKTSQRTSERLGQVVEAGYFKGGLAPYGYFFRKSGRFNKKGKELVELVIEDYESGIVRTMYDLYTNSGYGPQRISTYLRDRGIKARSGKDWHPATIRHILRNLTYTGVFRSGEYRSPQNPDIQIIDTDTFNLAQEIIKKRSNKTTEERSIPIRTSGNSLLSGNVFCGHCGSRLSYNNSIRKYRCGDGSVSEYSRPKYACYGRLRRQAECDGQSVYSLHIIDGIIEKIVHSIFAQYRGIPMSAIIKQGAHVRDKEVTAALRHAKSDQDKLAKELAALQSEIAKTITGESRFTADVLSAAISTTQGKFDIATEKVEQLAAEAACYEATNERLKKQYDEVIEFSTMFDNADMATKRMIISRIINRVDVFKGYKLRIDFNIDFSGISLEEFEEVIQAA